jgi:hypothetical protein
MKRWRFLILITVFACTAPVHAQAIKGIQSEDEIKREVLRVEEEQDHAVAIGDTKTLEQIWADDMVYTTPGGELLTKAQHLAEFRSGIRKFETMQHDDIEAWVYGQNVVVLMGRSTSTFQYKGEMSSGPRKFTNVFVRMDGRWQIVSHHVTDVAKP